AQVSAMRCGLLPISRAALLLGDVAYFDFHGEVEDEADRVELQKCLGPTCKVRGHLGEHGGGPAAPPCPAHVPHGSQILVLRNHGVLALGDTAEEAFYSIFHLQAACEVQVSALASAGGAENLIVLEGAKQRVPHGPSAVRRAGTTFGPLHKSRLGEHEFEALMRMLDNLGYRTGYTYRYPFVQEKSKPKSDVLIPATVTAFVFEEEPAGTPALRQHAQKQQKEKTRWLNTPNTYTRVNLAEEPQGSAGGQRTKTTWLRADEVEKGSSGTPIRIENPNQFVPLYTDPQEVLEMRNKVWPQEPRVAWGAWGSGAPPPKPPPGSPPEPPAPAEPVEGEWGDEDPKTRSGVPVSSWSGGTRGLWPNHSETHLDVTCVPLPVPVGIHGRRMWVSTGGFVGCRGHPCPPSPSSCSGGGNIPVFPVGSGCWGSGLLALPWCLVVSVCLSVSTTCPFSFLPPPVVVNGKDEEQSTEENLGKGGTDRTAPNADQDAPKEKETVTSTPVSPDGSPSKSPSKKKKKFRTPSFLKKGKKKEKIES
ncbi:ADDB protein, partial [Calyptomena viridis]|nr:ADDB protein [Calyptomena viridis]